MTGVMGCGASAHSHSPTGETQDAVAVGVQSCPV